VKIPPMNIYYGSSFVDTTDWAIPVDGVRVFARQTAVDHFEPIKFNGEYIRTGDPDFDVSLTCRECEKEVAKCVCGLFVGDVANDGTPF